MRKIMIHRSEWVECPSLGESIDDAIRMIREAIALHIEDLIAHGESVPPPD